MSQVRLQTSKDSVPSPLNHQIACSISFNTLRLPSSKSSHWLLSHLNCALWYLACPWDIGISSSLLVWSRLAPKPVVKPRACWKSLVHYTCSAEAVREWGWDERSCIAHKDTHFQRLSGLQLAEVKLCQGCQNHSFFCVNSKLLQIYFWSDNCKTVVSQLYWLLYW